MLRYINVTLIDDQGGASFSQILTKDPREAFDFMEQKQFDHSRGNRHLRPLVAGFIFDTGTEQFTHYVMSGLYAKIVTPELIASGR